MIHCQLILIVLLALVYCCPANGSSHLPRNLPAQSHASLAICRGSVTQLSSFRQPNTGLIYTRATIQVLETLKGKFPDYVQILHRGGVVGNEGEFDGHAPQLVVGEERIFFLSRRPDGTLFCADGRTDAVLVRGPKTPLNKSHQTFLKNLRHTIPTPFSVESDVTDQAAPAQSEPSLPVLAAGATELTGLLSDDAGLAARFLPPDQGMPIPYLVDADFLPAGISIEQALQAVEEALTAWTEVSSVQFKFVGMESFGQASPNISRTDGIIRIQLHDFHGYILGPTTLGIGGRGFFSNIIEPAGWATGGNVAGHEFHQSTRGYVVMKHTASALQNLATFTEVLCHEIGHVLSLDHSSENPDETNPELLDAMMYFEAHGDNRGARLGTWDVPILQQVHPADNTPPFSFNRIMEITTDSPAAPNLPGINEIQLRGYDLQTTQGLTLAITNYSANNGSIQLNGNLLRYMPNGFINAERLDPSGNSFYDRAHVRFSDGVNTSPPTSVRILSYNIDTRPTPEGDGIPDNWMKTYFGNEDPAGGFNRDAEDDADGDGLTNKKEFQIGTDPTDAESKLTLGRLTLETLQFKATPYHLYELQETSDFKTWKTILPPILPTNAIATVENLVPPSGPPRFFRLYKVP